ncbi:Probable Co/Zn/Cd efflux system membrane fusion protein [hydrothermal vent metagenome]|uniref:Probable Co/Zn/Cd efflux system membrane fusion protein n=1 Tax=hydrothermal vent metagenome TaxID=652676 RepID=A0A3B0ZWF6_9ZZZZ
MNIKKIIVTSLSIILLTSGSYVGIVYAQGDSHGSESEKSDDHGEEKGHEEGGHEEEGGHKEKGGHEEEAGVIKLSKEQMNAASIEVSLLKLQAVNETIKAPGEVKFNDYQTVKITPRIDAQVIKRHAVLGEQVVKGQPLVTLSSVDMAEVQGNLLVATREWNRVKKLGRKVVAERRFTEARANWNQLLTKARSYGMTETEIESLTSKSNKKSADGTFQLLAPLAGRVIYDQYIVGERIEPGRLLVSITNESVMWVEARLNSVQSAMVSEGNYAEIVFNKQSFPAKISQLHHTLDETTRTQAVRIEVNNPGDKLHSGMFVTANIASNEKMQALVLPEAAVVRSADGDWQIFIEGDEKGEFKAQEVELVKVIDGQAVIEGIKPGNHVVTKGAFFVQSELAKGGFEIHNH